MEKGKEKIFMTGATGVMGTAALRELMKYPENYEVSILARDSKKNKRKLKPYIDRDLEVVWGDLLDKKALRKGIKDSAFVLHIGGMVSPAAEHFPEKTIKVNVESMRLIASIVKEFEVENPNKEIAVVYVGSVSQYGSHLPPGHWGKVGDKLSAAKFDAYAYSKIMAERVLLEAGLRKWVSLRQTAILHSGLLQKANDPVTFHVPLNGAIEWITVEDSGRLMERVCRPEVPISFWNKCYNVGGGKGFRLTNLEFERGILKAMGCPEPAKIFETNWFATDNFHGIWFEDSDMLDDILHYRENGDFKSALDNMKKSLPFYFKLTPLAPAFLIKWFMKKVADDKYLGPLNWLKTNNYQRIKAAWGSIERYNEIPGWHEYKEPELVREPDRQPYVEDEKEIKNIITQTKCEFGHEYLTSEALQYFGHTCPECLRLQTEV